MLQVWNLYNTHHMDFHLFFCCANVRKLAAMLPEDERSSVRPLWQVMINATHASSDTACLCCLQTQAANILHP